MNATVNSRAELVQDVVNRTLRAWGIRRAVVLGAGSSLTNDAERALIKALQEAIPGVKLPPRLQVEGTARDGFRLVNLPS